MPGQKYRSIQNPKQYRALRRQGMDKTTAARISNARTPGRRVKSGERIAGQLCRAADGRYVNCNSREATPESKRELRKRAREQEQSETRRANEAAVGEQAGIDPSLSDALLEFASPDENITLAPQNAQALIDRGLVETNPDGSYRISQAGRSYVAAARAGDVSRARDALGRGSERMQQRQERATAQQQRAQAREQRRQEIAARRAAREQARMQREAEPPKGGGGGRREDKPATDPRLLAQLRRLLGGRAETGRPPASSGATAAKSLTVFKDAKGADRWLSITTSAYKDKDNEWITCRAIAKVVEQGDRTGHRGVLRFWHVPGLDFGTCDYQATMQDGRFLVESGTCYSPRHASVVRQAAKAGYEMSPGFLHAADAPGPAHAFDAIAVFERSFVPPGRASNPYTRLLTKEHRMLNQEKLKALRDLINDPALLSDLVSSVEATDKAAQSDGAVYKDAPPWAQALIGRIEALETSTKASMPPAVMAEAAETEAMDAQFLMDKANEEATAPTPVMDVVDMTADDLRALIAEALGAMLDTRLAEYGTKMSEMKAQYEAMGKAFGTMQAQKDDATQKHAADLAALAARLGVLEGDQPASASTVFRPSADPSNRVAVKDDTLTNPYAAADSWLWPQG